MSTEFISMVYRGREFDDPAVGLDDLFQRLNDAPERAVKQLSVDLKAYLQRVAEQLKKRHSRTWAPDSSNPDLHVRSGEGLASIMRSISVYGGRLDSLAGQISTGKMTIHETGGVIAATGGGYLTVPLPAALDARGVPLRQSARDWPNTFTQMSKRGNLIIFQNQGRRQPVPLYVLKREVRLKPRLHMRDTVMGELPFFMERALDTLTAEFTR